MKLSIDWIQDFLDKPVDVTTVAEDLTLKTAEVEEVISLAENMEHVIVVEVVELLPHPNADKLQIAKVSPSPGKLHTVVCGAPNIKVGQKVALAKPGAVLGDMNIKKREIRGELSEGMIVSEAEIGIGDDADGIMVLPVTAEIGMPLTKALKLDDTILDIENKTITHRSDLFSHIGFANEIATIENIPFREPETPEIKLGTEKISVTVKDQAFCRRYMAIKIDGISVEESPSWMKNRLRAIGQQSVNNIVDATNYVMFELGQPLHAFDADVIGDAIIVRAAKADEKITLLDGEKAKLTKEDFVIANKEDALAVAGVIGGDKSGVTEKTTSIIIESARFDPIAVRKTAQRLGIRTESHTRFEKGLVDESAERGLMRVVELILEMTDGKVVSELVDVWEKPKSRASIPFSQDDLERVIGIKVRNADEILKKLGFAVKDGEVKAPWWRPDVTITEDVVEEVARVFGLENIPSQTIVGKLKPLKPEPTLYWERSLVDTMKGLGWTEAYLYSLYGEELLEKTGLNQKHRRIINPLSEDLALLRVSLLPNLLAAAEKNQHECSDLKLYERGHVFVDKERHHLGGIAFGEGALFDIKGSIEALCRTLNIPISWKQVEAAKPFTGQALTFIIDKTEIGTVGVIDPDVQAAFGIDYLTAGFELDWGILAEHASNFATFEAIPEFPPIKVDVAAIVEEEVTWAEIEDAVKKADKQITQLEVFDVYRGKQIPAGKKSVAFSFAIQAKDKTLTKEEAGDVLDAVETALKTAMNAEIRKS